MDIQKNGDKRRHCLHLSLSQATRQTESLRLGGLSPSDVSNVGLIDWSGKDGNETENEKTQSAAFGGDAK